MNIIQEKWRENKLLIMEGIIFNDGRILIMDLMDRSLDGFFLSPHETNVESYLFQYPNYWSDIVFQDKFYLPDSLGEVWCGGGAYGGDGFVTLVLNGALVWSVFFQSTNPFIKIDYINGDIIVVSGNDYELFIPYDTPENLRMKN